MAKRKEESIGEQDEPKLERLELRFLPSVEMTCPTSIMAQERERLKETFEENCTFGVDL